MFLKIGGIEQEKTLKIGNASEGLEDFVKYWFEVFGYWRHVDRWILRLLMQIRADMCQLKEAVVVKEGGDGRCL